MERRSNDRADRDDIVKLQVQVDRVIHDIEGDKILRWNVDESIKARFDTLDERLRLVERNMYIALGALGLLEFVTRWIFGH